MLFNVEVHWCVVVNLGRVAARGQVKEAINSVGDIERHADQVSQSASRLSVSIYAMLGWVATVTVAMATVAMLTLWRRRRRAPDKTQPDDADFGTLESDWTRRSLASAEEAAMSRTPSMSPSSSSSQVISVSE